MNKLVKTIFVAITLLSIGCNQTNDNSTPPTKDFGVFLGATDKDINKLLDYQTVAIDIDEFSSSSISKFKENEIDIYAYLSIGSLEIYRPYYDEFKDYTFYDYENWPDEKWIDVSVISWQSLLIKEAKRMEGLGANGLFLDNFDVYYIAVEEYQGNEDFCECIYNGCRTILDELSKLNINLLINSGTDFLERLDEEHDSLLDKVTYYAQECVFSSIEDYDNDVFSTQDLETQEYYMEIIKMMKKYSNILLIEYTTESSLVSKIENWAINNDAHYYISSSVNLTV